MKRFISSVLSALIGAVIGAKVIGVKEKKKTKIEKGYADKHLALFVMMDQWVQVKQEGKHLADYLEKNGYMEIAIYGMSYAGERLIAELRDSKISVKYGIDKKADELYSNIDIVSPEDDLSEVDAVIVTSIFFMDEIEERLSCKLSCPIISLEDILYEI